MAICVSMPLTMIFFMIKQKLHFDNLDEALKSSTSAARKGTQQFETPTEHAEALCLPCRACGPSCLTRNAGMARSCERRDGSQRLLGIDIDPTAEAGGFGIGAGQQGELPDLRSRKA